MDWKTAARHVLSVVVLSVGVYFLIPSITTLLLKMVTAVEDRVLSAKAQQGAKQPAPQIPMMPAPMPTWIIGENTASPTCSRAVIAPSGAILATCQSKLAALKLDGSTSWNSAEKDGKDLRLGPPVLSPDGTIVVPGRGMITAYDSAGRVRWTFKGEDPRKIFNQPVIAADERVFVIGDDTHLYAISAQGKQLWERDLKYHTSSLKIGPDNRLYASTAGKIFVYDEQGTRLSSFGHSNNYAPLIIDDFGQNGTIFVSGRKIAALNPDESLLWESPCSTPGLAYMETGIVTPCNSGKDNGKGKLAALKYEDGSTLWEASLDDALNRPVTIALDGSIYATSSRKIYAFSAQGRPLWSFLPEQAPDSRIAIDPDGNLYFGCDQNRVYSLTPEGKLRWIYVVGMHDMQVKYVDQLNWLNNGLLVHAGGELIALPVAGAGLRAAAAEERMY